MATRLVLLGIFCLRRRLDSSCVTALTIVILLFISTYAQAQAPITSSGLNTVVTTTGNVHEITGGTRPGGGANLFHSFGDFNVPNNNIANFLNAGSVDLAGYSLPAGLATSNILGRVTGGNISNTFGTIPTTGFEPGSPLRRARR